MEMERTSSHKDRHEISKLVNFSISLCKVLCGQLIDIGFESAGRPSYGRVRVENDALPLSNLGTFGFPKILMAMLFGNKSISARLEKAIIWRLVVRQKRVSRQTSQQSYWNGGLKVENWSASEKVCGCYDWSRITNLPGRISRLCRVCWFKS